MTEPDSLTPVLLLLGPTLLFGGFAVMMWRGQTWFVMTSREPPNPPGRLNVLVCKWVATIGACVCGFLFVQALADRL